MPMLADDTVIGLWEKGRGRNAVVRGLLLLEAALPALDQRAHAAMSVAARDRVLLQFRGAAFGRRMPAQTSCPECGGELEFELDAEQLGDELPPHDFVLSDGTRFRLPTSADLLAVDASDIDAGCREIARRCCLNDGAVLGETAIGDADSRMSAIHAAASIALRLECVVCGHLWRDQFDIVTYFWTEIEERARDLFDQVHLLASHYGWSERVILAMSEARRAAYLDRCGA